MHGRLSAVRGHPAAGQLARLYALVRLFVNAFQPSSDATRIAAPTAEKTVPIDTFVSGLRTAWQDGQVRPTSQPKPKAERGRRRPDPLAAVTDDLRVRFNADPASTGRRLLERLQATHPGCYPDGLMRTVQRRLKIWRSEMAHALVFGRGAQTPSRDAPPASAVWRPWDNVYPAGCEHDGVLAVWPVYDGARGRGGATANLDGVCARRH